MEGHCLKIWLDGYESYRENANLIYHIIRIPENTMLENLWFDGFYNAEEDVKHQRRYDFGGES